MSTHHTCPRCGYQQHAGQHPALRWTDRHPAATVALAVVGLISVTGYPWLLAVLAVAGLAYLADREGQRRAAVAARADFEHAALLAAQARPLVLPPLPRQHPAYALMTAPTKPQRRVRN